MNALAWLKTKEGKVTAGAGAAAVVAVLALRKNAGKAAGGGGFSADALQTGPDGTLQDRLDQVGMHGGTLEEWIDATTGLAGSVNHLTDLIDARDPMTSPSTPPKAPGKPLASGAYRLPDGKVVVKQRIGKVGQGYDLRTIAKRYALSKDPNAVESTLRGIRRLNPGLKSNTVPGGYALVVADPRYYGKTG